MTCLYCGKPLSFLSRLRYQRYCSDAHHREYLNGQETSAFRELIQTKSRTSAREPEPLAAVAVAASGGNPQEAVAALVSSPNGEDAIGATAESSTVSSEASESYAHFLSIVDAERHYYQTILESLPAGVAIFLEDRSLAFCNRSFRKLMDDGVRDIYERNLDDFFEHEGVRRAVLEILEGSASGAEIAIENLGGSEGVNMVFSIAPLTAKDGNLGPQVLVSLSVLTAPAVPAG